MKTKLKNYTSGVSADKSILAIERNLVSHGASGILKEYGPGGVLSAIAFTVDSKEGKMAFKVYARADVVNKILREGVRRPHKGTFSKIAEQSSKTAWKILSDWVDAQMAMVDLGQRELLAVFLADAYDSKKQKTFFEKIQDGQMKMLTSRSEDE